MKQHPNNSRKRKNKTKNRNHANTFIFLNVYSALNFIVTSVFHWYIWYNIVVVYAMHDVRCTFFMK